MTTLLRRRLVSLCAVGALVVGGIGYSAFTAWRELGALRRRLTTAEFEGFRIAGELNSNVVGVNSALLAYVISDQDRDWQEFEKKSERLNTWIEQQRNALKSLREIQVLAEIDTEYDRYLAVAKAIRQERSQGRAALASRVHQLDAAADRMFNLAGRLAEAHRSTLGDLLAEAQSSLRKLESLFVGGFVLILAGAYWAAALLFREMIAPLRRRLVEVQELAARSEKLASLGVLAAGVAHEIRNPLTALKIRTFALRRKIASNESALRDISIIDGEIDRLERIVGDFLLFARPGDPEFAVISPNQIIREIRDLLAPELAAGGVEILLQPNADVPEIHADAHQLKQVLINLVRNAAESIRNTGRITLRVRADQLPLGGDWQSVVVIEVQDTGTGIPAELQQRLFDPFFTTKPAGTGLGLSIAMRILERHGGTLQFETAPGHGTTFGVVLPRHFPDATVTDDNSSGKSAALARVLVILACVWTAPVCFSAQQDGPGQTAGLRPGDVVLRIGRRPIRNLDDTIDATFFTTAEEEVTVVVGRAGRQYEITVIPMDPPKN